MRHIRPGVRGRVVIFDQFEELFTQHAERFEDRKGFFDDVIEAMHADPGLRVVFAMRWDDPEHRRLLQLEGLKQWMPAREEGYDSLRAALDHQGGW